MRTINHCYLNSNSPLRSLFLSAITAMLLAGCGIKGDLYQTPEQPVQDQGTKAVDADETVNSDENKPEVAPLATKPQQPAKEQAEPVKEQ